MTTLVHTKKHLFVNFSQKFLFFILNIPSRKGVPEKLKIETFREDMTKRRLFIIRECDHSMTSVSHKGGNLGVKILHLLSFVFVVRMSLGTMCDAE